MESNDNHLHFESILKGNRQKVQTFLELWRKYNLFDTFTFKNGPLYQNLWALGMLSFCIEYMSHEELLQNLESCMWDIFDMQKFSNIFKPFYIDRLQNLDSFKKSVSITSQEILRAQQDRGLYWAFPPNLSFLPEWYVQSKENLWDELSTTRPFHDKLEKKLATIPAQIEAGKNKELTHNAQQKLIYNFLSESESKND